MWTIKPALRLAAFAAVLVSASTAWADQAPVGLWIDHTGRGGVEITRCGKRLCGHIAWLKNAKNSEACGIQVIGDAKPMGNGTWDRGWIYDPEANSKYDVELKPLSSKKLRVLGYAGTKFLSETMIWKRAPAGLKKCRKPQRESAAPGDVSETAVETSQSTAEKTKATTVKEVTSQDVLPQRTETAAKPETKNETKGTSESAAEAVADTSDEGSVSKPRSGSKRLCKLSVPFLNVVVKVPCDG